MGSLMGSFANGPALLFASRILEGLGFVSVAVAAPTMILGLTHPSEVRMTLSIWSCYVPAGMAVILVLAPLLSGFGWRGMWQVNTLILTAYAILVTMDGRRSSDRSLGRGVRTRQLWEDLCKTSASIGPCLLAAMFSTYSLMWLAVMGFLPTLLMEEYGVKTDDASFLTALMVAVNVPGNLSGGWLLQKGVRRSRLIIWVIVIMGGCSVIIYSPSVPFMVRYLACLAFSGCGGALPASLTSGVPVHAPEPRLVGTTNGLITQGSNLGQVIGPPILALIVSATGWEGAPWFLGSVAGIGILLAFCLVRLEIRGESNSRRKSLYS